MLAGFAAAAGSIRDAAAGPFVSKEYQIKAAFLYNFTKFIKWPLQSFADPGSPIVIGVYCPNAADAELEQIVRDRKVNGRALVVKKIAAADDVKSTHVLFVCTALDPRFVRLAETIKDSPIVTVGESEDFGLVGGMIKFVLEDDNVRFEINTASAERAGLRVSAQLQKLATVVRRLP